MNGASAVVSARFEQKYGVKLPPCEVTAEFLTAVLDRRHVTVVPPVDGNARAYRWYCSCGNQGASKRARAVAVTGGAAHERNPRGGNR